MCAAFYHTKTFAILDTIYDSLSQEVCDKVESVINYYGCIATLEKDLKRSPYLNATFVPQLKRAIAGDFKSVNSKAKYCIGIFFNLTYASEGVGGILSHSYWIASPYGCLQGDWTKLKEALGLPT